MYQYPIPPSVSYLYKPFTTEDFAHDFTLQQRWFATVEKLECDAWEQARANIPVEFTDSELDDLYNTAWLAGIATAEEYPQPGTSEGFLF